MAKPAKSEKKINRPGPRAVAFIGWMRARGTNTTQVATKASVPYTTLAAFVQGATRSLKGENEEKITEAYGQSAAQIFGGDDRGARAIPIISDVPGGKLADPKYQIEGELQTIEISGLEPGDYFATRVNGTSMDRISPHNSLILVNRAERDLIRGRRYIFARGGETTYKRWENDPYPRLEPETTDPDTNKIIYPKSDEEWSVIGRVRLTLMDDL